MLAKRSFMITAPTLRDDGTRKDYRQRVVVQLGCHCREGCLARPDLGTHGSARAKTMKTPPCTFEVPVTD